MSQDLIEELCGFVSLVCRVDKADSVEKERQRGIQECHSQQQQQQQQQ
eukprot:COSAG02_NODE_547_length_20492_cov_265.508802_7_plen_48_part_00